MSVSVQYEHLHTILHSSFFIGLSVEQCEQGLTSAIFRAVKKVERFFCPKVVCANTDCETEGVHPKERDCNVEIPL